MPPSGFPAPQNVSLLDPPSGFLQRRNGRRPHTSRLQWRYKLLFSHFTIDVNDQCQRHQKRLSYGLSASFFLGESAITPSQARYRRIANRARPICDINQFTPCETETFWPHKVCIGTSFSLLIRTETLPLATARSHLGSSRSPAHKLHPKDLAGHSGSCGTQVPTS